jgi:hypothetical protein
MAAYGRIVGLLVSISQHQPSELILCAATPTAEFCEDKFRGRRSHPSEISRSCSHYSSFSCSLSRSRS